MKKCLEALEKYIHQSDDLPPLVRIGIIHVQFETIHPFLDGNGRIGRLLITLLLYERGVLTAPVLYLSLYLRRNRTEYFKLLMDVRNDGAWEQWLNFFLRGVAEAADEATATAQKVHAMREEHRRQLTSHKGKVKDLELLDQLFSQPLVNTSWVMKSAGVSQPTADAMLARFEAAGILTEITGQQRYRVFRYDAYLSLFDQSATEASADETHA